VRRLVGVIALCLLTLPALCQSTSKYQVATILDVKQHQEDGAHASVVTRYDISVKVGDTIYVALCPLPSGEIDAKYAAGREILVLVEKTTITYNDILGRSYEVPILSQQPAAPPRERSR
jgi:hypothetical protein